jgi:hypothetical protein
MSFASAIFDSEQQLKNCWNTFSECLESRIFCAGSNRLGWKSVRMMLQYEQMYTYKRALAVVTSTASLKTASYALRYALKSFQPS